MASRSITVKVAVPKVINSLEVRLAKIKNDYANQEKLEAEFQTELTAWREQLLAYAVANFDKAANVRTNYRQWNKSLNIDFDVNTDGTDFPAEPTRNYEQMGSYDYKEQVSEIQNALNILGMTDEEYVNASTMKSIAKYL